MSEYITITVADAFRKRKQIAEKNKLSAFKDVAEYVERKLIENGNITIGMAWLWEDLGWTLGGRFRQAPTEAHARVWMHEVCEAFEQAGWKVEYRKGWFSEKWTIST